MTDTKPKEQPKTSGPKAQKGTVKVSIQIGKEK